MDTDNWVMKAWGGLGTSEGGQWGGGRDGGPSLILKTIKIFLKRNCKFTSK